MIFCNPVPVMSVDEYQLAIFGPYDESIPNPFGMVSLFSFFLLSYNLPST